MTTINESKSCIWTYFYLQFNYILHISIYTNEFIEKKWINFFFFSSYKCLLSSFLGKSGEINFLYALPFFLICNWQHWLWDNLSQCWHCEAVPQGRLGGWRQATKVGFEILMRPSSKLLRRLSCLGCPPIRSSPTGCVLKNAKGRKIDIILTIFWI